MFNSIKMHLVPHFPIILLYSLKMTLLDIYHAKFHARTRSISLLRKTKIYVNVLGANNTTIIHKQETNQFQ